MRLALPSLAALGLALACGGSSIRTGDRDGDDGGGGRSGSSPQAGGTAGKSGGTGPGPVGGTGAISTGATGGSVVAGTGGTAIGKGGGSTSMDGPLDPPGPVLCGGAVCAAPRACCLSNSRCFDPRTEPEVCAVPDPASNPEGLQPCASNAHCLSGDYCSLEWSYLCQGEGFCRSRSNCPSSGYAVCGCDGNSYANIETACRSAANASAIFIGGACGDTVDLNQGETTPRWVTLCGSDAHCARGERCCTITGTCYPPSDPGRCQMPPEGTRYPCTADDQCYPGGEFCAGIGCSGPGGCVSLEERSEDCGVRLEPVCGCNGVTYTSAACAWAEGVRVASEGECALDR